MKTNRKKFNQFKCWIKYKVLKLKRRPEATRKFWEEAKNDSWRNYLVGQEKSEFLLRLIKKLRLGFSAKILELGCNIGRNLNYLSSAGYKNVGGMELNEEAVKMSSMFFPRLRNKIALTTIEDYFLYKKGSERFKLIFTMAVLEHLPKESEWVFAEMVKCAKYIITVEDERSINKVCFPRNYKKIFEDLGMREVYHIGCNNVHPSLTESFVARIFVND